MPWISGSVLVFLAAGAVTLFGFAHPRFALPAGGFIAFLSGLHALAALAFTPAHVTGRIARRTAAQLEAVERPAA